MLLNWQRHWHWHKHWHWQDIHIWFWCKEWHCCKSLPFKVLFGCKTGTVVRPTFWLLTFDTVAKLLKLLRCSLVGKRGLWSVPPHAWSHPSRMWPCKQCELHPIIELIKILLKYQNYQNIKILDLIKINLRYSDSLLIFRLTAALRMGNVVPQKNIVDVGPASTIARVRGHNVLLARKYKR